MRLTLRALLASVHGLLLPEDEEQLQQKIKESPFAQQLLSHIQDRIKRKEVSPLPLQGMGLSRDPNVTAEYLDHELSSEEVPELEQICFQSDRHLAEVAACHQILSLHLGQPIEIPTKLRDTLYKISPSSHKEATTVPPSKNVETASVPVEPPTYTHPLKDLDGSGAQPQFTAEQENRSAKHKPSLLPVEQSNDLDSKSRRSVPQKKSQGVWLIIAATVLIGTGFFWVWNQSENDFFAFSTDLNSENITSNSESKPGTMSNEPTVASSNLVANSNLESSTNVTPVSYLENLPTQNSLQQAGPTVISQSGLSLQFGSTDNRLSVLHPGSTVTLKTETIVSPGGRSVIDLGDQARLVAIDQSRFSIADQQKISHRYGKYLLKLTPALPVIVQLENKPLFSISSSDPQGLIAYSISAIRIPGKNPSKTPRIIRTELWCLNGSVELKFPNQESLNLSMGDFLSVQGNSEPNSRSNTVSPTWISQSNQQTLEHESFKQLATKLNLSKQPNYELQQLTENGIANLRDAAIRISAMIGNFSPLLKSLKDPGQHAYWDSQFPLVLNTAWMNELEHQQLDRAIENEYQSSASFFSRITWDYTADQFEMGELGRLIDLLNHTELEVRVAAFSILKSHTGLSLDYQPEQSAAVRSHATRLWWQRWRDGQIQYRDY